MEGAKIDDIVTGWNQGRNLIDAAIGVISEPGRGEESTGRLRAVIGNILTTMSEKLNSDVPMVRYNEFFRIMRDSEPPVTAADFHAVSEAMIEVIHHFNLFLDSFHQAIHQIPGKDDAALDHSVHVAFFLADLAKHALYLARYASPQTGRASSRTGGRGPFSRGDVPATGRITT